MARTTHSHNRHHGTIPVAQVPVGTASDEVAAGDHGHASEDVTYDNTTSGLTATDVKAAIDELKALIDAL